MWKMARISSIFVIFVKILSISGFRTPRQDVSGQVPYGRLLRAVLSGRVPAAPFDQEIPESLQWWHSLSRNNTIDCECGTFFTSSNSDRWIEEGIYSLNIYPWSVSLVARGGVYAFCGGSLINDRYVLTSASCVDGLTSKEVEVLIGSWPTAHYPNNTDPDQLNPKALQRKKVHRVILHPDYVDVHLDNNIALLRLEGPVTTFGNKGGVSPVCLPKSTTSSLFDGKNSSTLLWRFHEDEARIWPVKRTEVNSVILSKEECKGYEYNKGWSNMPDTMMCARLEFPTNHSHPYIHSYDCPGDSGGFLLTTEGHQKIQVGIDSWTACYGKPKGVGIYTRITEFLPWINKHISKDGRLCAK